jgi:HEPN domain-containing protein
MRKEVKEWWKQSKRDLITAENCKNSKDYYAGAFFCQQSVEKGLKALYIAKKRMFPGATHSLIYGTPYELYDEDIVNEILEKSKEVIKWIESQIEM